MRPEFVSALHSCFNFSSKITLTINNLDERGRSAGLLKTSSKRKRIRSEVEDVKEEEKELKEDKHQFLQ